MAIVGCHLAAGKENIALRIDEVKQIMNMTIDGKTSIDQHDSAIIMGDMNFIVEDNDHMRKYYLKKYMWESYSSGDQLTKRKRETFHNFSEWLLNYPPTIKLPIDNDVM